jgi:phosphoribosyl-AMP cyclohydrolase
MGGGIVMMSERATDELPNFAAGPNGLLPAIAQDHASGRVLMMAWMSRESWAETLATGQACYYSRSRKALWRKGETSGHRQRVVKIQLDCDADCILLQVEQLGAACHEGYASCFFRTVHPDLSIAIEEARLVDPGEIYGRD